MGRRLVLFTLALILAIGGTGAVLTYVSKADSRALAKEQPVLVVTASHAMPAGTSVQEAKAKGWFATTQIPRKTVPAGALTDVGALDNEVALTAVYSGQIIMPTLFGAKVASTSGLSLAPGTMALTVQADDPMRVADFLTAGSQVAVFDTFNSATGSTPPWTPSGDGLSSDPAADPATRLLLPRVTVLAVGSGASTAASDTPNGATATQATGTSDPGALLTLQVVQADAEKLIQGEQTGHLYFALVNDQSKLAPTGGVDNRGLFGGN